jgi:hypothetical protein
MNISQRCNNTAKIAIELSGKWAPLHPILLQRHEEELKKGGNKLAIRKEKNIASSPTTLP